MADHTVSAAALIPAPAQRVYTIIADYHDWHPRILPRPTFVALVVEHGGVGAGTVIRVQMKFMGRLQTFRATVSEPEPGRVLVETNENGSVTTFTVEPRNDGQHAYVTITTATMVRDGLIGRIESWLITRLLRPVYSKELAQLAKVAA